MDIIARLNEFVNQRRLSSSQFADLLGIPRPSISQILSGRNKKISNEFLGKLHNAFPNLDLMWLMFGEESTSGSTPSNNEITEHREGADKPCINTPTLFDTQDSIPYHQDDDTLTNNGRACEGVIDDLKNTAPYLREINASSQSTINITQTKQTSEPKNEQANIGNNNTMIQSNESIDASSIASSPNIHASQRIESIIVYYKDKTFEVFRPE